MYLVAIIRIFFWSTLFFPLEKFEANIKTTLFCLKIFPRSMHLKDAAMTLCPSNKGKDEEMTAFFHLVCLSFIFKMKPPISFH